MKNKKATALRAAFPNTVPIMTGFLFLGMTYGIYMRAKGFSFLYPLFMSMTIFAGSMEFVTCDMLLGAFNPLQAFLMTLMINARHLFYGISMLEKYKGLGKKKAYLIFGLCDETFSVNCTANVPEGVDRGWFMFFVTLLDHIYWVGGACIGALLGNHIFFNTEGLDFVMTAMFVVIFIEQWKKDKSHICGAAGIIISVLCLCIFGAESFVIPSMLLILAFLTFVRGPLEGKDKL